MVECGLCGYGYNGYSTGKLKKTSSYRCKGGMSGSNLMPRCKNKEISEHLMFKYCWNELERNLSNPNNFKAIVLNKDKNKEIIGGLNRRLSEIDKLISSKKKTLENIEIRELEASSDSQRERYKLLILQYLGDIREFEVEKTNTITQISDIRSVDKKYKDVKKFGEIHQESIKNISDSQKIALMKKYIIKIIRKPGKIIFDFDFVDGFDGKDWRDGKEGINKKLKSESDFRELYFIKDRKKGIKNKVYK